MKKSVYDKLNGTKKSIIIFDVLLALLIICSSFFLIKTTLGSAVLAFGFAMLTITIILRILQRW